LNVGDKRRAIVIGGSLGGLLTGLLLRQAGWRVDIYERVAGELSDRGAGIVVQPILIERLRALGLEPVDLGVSVETRKLFDAQGGIAATYRCPQILTAWERIYRFLRDAFPAEHYHRGRTLTGFTQDTNSVVATFADGSSEEADILVGADGIRSTVRHICLPELAAQYVGYVAWRALLAEQDFPPAAHAELFPFMSFGLPPGEQFLGYPVAGPDDDLREGHRRYNVVWYRPAEESTELADLLTDAQGVTHSVSIPPTLIRREKIDELRAAASLSLGRQLREVVDLIDEPLLQPIYDLETPRMAFGRVAILGDAAFVARPHVAAGVTKAADDAAALAKALTDESDVEAALKAFEQARLAANRRIIERARHLGAYLQATQTADERARSQRHSIPEAVLAETAVLDF
jgi:2-polyprenyl-6-methoxyphenol hydroxylase-like FAD-dependent oxidoreductase